MRSFLDAKPMAKSLRDSLARKDIDVSHAESLEIVAHQFGFDNWNVLAARIAREGNGAEVRLDEAIPILRIFSVEKAKEFYLDFLGFELESEFGDAPVYMHISRSGLKLHLSEHHGDASPGSTVFLWMTGIDAYQRELTAKKYPYNRPRIVDVPWGRLLEVGDPFGNSIRFSERPRH